MNNHTKLTILICFLFFGINGFAGNKKPNIVLFIADDCTYWDIGCYGSPDAITPTLDKLAGEGMKFTSCYQAAAMCSPTRHNLYTGMYPVRTGAYPNKTYANNDIKSIVHYLKPLGYRVALSGKSHVGPKSVFPFEYMELDFSEIENFISDSEDNNQPFCLFVCSWDPHWPWNKGDSTLFDPEKITIPKNIVDTKKTRSAYARYLSEINYVDSQVDSTLQMLEKHNLSENTLFVFLSEQGSSFPPAKWTCYDAGVKSAFIAKWPGVINPGTNSDALVEYSDIVPTFIDAAGGKAVKGLDGKSMLPLFQQKKNKHKKYAYSIHTTRGIRNGSDYYPIRTVTDGDFKYILNLSHESNFRNNVTCDKFVWWPAMKQKAETDDNAKMLVENYEKRPAEELYNVRTDKENISNLANDSDYAAIKKKLKRKLLEWMEYCGDKGVETELRAFERLARFKDTDIPILTNEIVPPETTKNLEHGILYRLYGEQIKKPDEISRNSQILEEKIVPSFSSLNGTERKTGDNKTSCFETYIEVPEEGYYTFYINSEIKGQLFISNRLTIEKDKPGSEYGIIGLAKGIHKVQALINDGDAKGFAIQWSSNLFLKKEIENYYTTE